ncbi:MAG: hypothetical protein IJS13_01875 [Paludibacteraceae bacterium]|nr:hypothetical protein [Paludibacteraceae bacterium]
MVWIENIVRLVVLFLLQLLLVNNLYFLGIVHPCVYVFFLLALPAEVNRYWLLVIGFLTGLLMDVFCNSFGAHAAACTLLCFVRPFLLGRLVQEDERLTGTMNVTALGWEVYIKYVVILVLLHHITLFMLEAFSFRLFWLTLLQILLSALLTIVIIFGYEFARVR